MITYKTKNSLRSDLDICFMSFDYKKTHRGEFANKVLNVLVQHIKGSDLDSEIVYESIAGSDKNSLSFIQSLIGGLVMTNREPTAMVLAKRAVVSFPELLLEQSYSNSLN